MSYGFIFFTVLEQRKYADVKKETRQKLSKKTQTEKKIK